MIRARKFLNSTIIVKCEIWAVPIKDSTIVKFVILAPRSSDSTIVESVVSPPFAVTLPSLSFKKVKILRR